MGTGVLHSDGKKDRTKVIVAFRNFAKAPSALKVNVLFVSNANGFPKKHCFLKVPRLLPFVLLRAASRR